MGGAKSGELVLCASVFPFRVLSVLSTLKRGGGLQMIGHSIAFVIGQNCIVAFRLSFALGGSRLGLTSIRLLMLPRFRLFPSYRFLYGLFGFAFGRLLS